ncbi:hypothetical protein TNIN_284501 [Trichonephila inaurata madagascariensis]|uniref:Uncharacterized protein n=1 Tax=Trichonephila inaurata madagascariensis TaxID=2747483 RepID=A0A8X7BY79_9ARAC|nr:hypothetical protein TNIN_284501 [Trichonephila inaurata madagascariensis]
MSDSDSDGILGSISDSDSDKESDVDCTLEYFEKAQEMKTIVKTLMDKNLFFWKFFSDVQDKISLLRLKANTLDFALRNKFQSEDSADLPLNAFRNICQESTRYTSSAQSYRKFIMDLLQKSDKVVVRLLHCINSYISPDMEKEEWIQLTKEIKVHHVLLNSFINRCLQMSEDFSAYVDRLDYQYHLNIAHTVEN